MKRLVVVPSDPILAYERAGYDWLERYYNPGGMFAEVFALSPLEKGERTAYGMTIRGVPKERFRDALRELQPAVVRAYGGYWACDLVCAQRLFEVPVVVSVHDTNPKRIHPSVREADLVICMSRAVAQGVRARGTAPGRIRMLPNRVDVEFFHPVTDPGQLEPLNRRFPPGKHLLHVGRKTEQKNLDTVIRSLAILPKEYSCVFVGMGPADSYQSLAVSLGVAGRCFWIESVRNSELPLWYSWCDCLCVPSRWEGFGIIFLEAAACEAAIVTSNIAPMNEYLAADRSACLVGDFENPAALAAAVRRTCEDLRYREKIRQGARRAVQPFERRIVDEAECAIYREALALPRDRWGRFWRNVRVRMVRGGDLGPAAGWNTP